VTSQIRSRRLPLRRRARILRRESDRKARRFASLVLETVGQVGEVWRPLRRDDFGRGTGRPVLLLHGFGAPRRILHVLERRLRRNLGVAVMSFHLPGLGGALGGTDIESEARRLADKLERLCERHNVKELDIVGHSKGGLVARYMVSNHLVGRKVRTLITLGSPFRGAPLAILGAATLGILSKSVWQLLPFSPFLRDMRKTPVPRGMRLVSVAGSMDMVAPYLMCKANDDEADPGRVENFVVTGVGHNGLLLSRRVFKIVSETLQGRRAV